MANSLAKVTSVLACGVVLAASTGFAQDKFPEDNGIYEYHRAPDYRESESHPLRVLGYILHPIGWVAREAIFRPISYFASSTPTRRSVMGYREPYSYRQPECFTSDDVTPDCRTILPFNYDRPRAVEETVAASEIYFPNVNFDFNRRRLNSEGRTKAAEIARILNENQGVHVVLEGHADSRGSEQYNLKLGVDRAEAVRAELLKLNVDDSRLATVSFGETKPIFNEKNENSYSANRRVEVRRQDFGASAEPVQIERENLTQAERINRDRAAY